MNYYYDNASLPSGAPSSFARGYSSGKLVAVTYGSSSSNGDYNGYDELGRIIRHVQQTDSVNYLIGATYYLNSTMATETYPAVPGATEHAEQFGQWAEGRDLQDCRCEDSTVEADKFMRLESLDGIGPARYGKLHQLNNALIGKVP